jgi:hypothetical protein
MGPPIGCLQSSAIFPAAVLNDGFLLQADLQFQLEPASPARDECEARNDNPGTAALIVPRARDAQPFPPVFTQEPACF